MATMMRFLISLLLLLAVSVHAQLNPTPFSKGLINTNTSATMWRTNLQALQGVETNGSSSVSVRAHTPIVIGGSTAGANGSYAFTSQVGDKVVWTKAGDSSLTMETNPDDFPNTTIIRDNPGLGILYATITENIDGFYYPDANAWEPVEGPADTITTTFTTNIVVTLYPVSRVTNSFFLDSWYQGAPAFVQATGSDAIGSAGGVPFASLGGADGIGQNKYIIMKSDNYTGGNAHLQNGTILFGNGSKLNNSGLNTTNFNRVYDISTDTQPNINITNVLSKSIMSHVHVEDTTDYMIVNMVAGFLQYLTPTIEGTWDGLIIDNSSTNSFIQMVNPVFKQEQDGRTGVTWGMHGIGYKVSSTSGSRLQLVGGVISVLNTTNKVWTSPTSELPGDACIYVGQKSGTSGNGNASIEIYGTALVHGSTNANTVVNAISNSVNVPIHGMYFDVIPGADSTKPIVSAQMHSFDGIRTPVIVVPKTASYSLTTNEFNKRFNNSGAAGSITYSLPAATVGATFVFKVVTAQSLVIDAATSDTIQYSTSVTAASGSINSATIGSSITLTCDAANKWFAESMVGVWLP